MTPARKVLIGLSAVAGILLLGPYVGLNMISNSPEPPSNVTPPKSREQPSIRRPSSARFGSRATITGDDTITSGPTPSPSTDRKSLSEIEDLLK